MFRASLLLLVALLTFGLAVVASASPPDPTWVPGFWDDNDQDDAVNFLLSLVGSLVGSASASAPCDRVVTLDVCPVVTFVPSHSLASTATRAPPFRAV